VGGNFIGVNMKNWREINNEFKNEFRGVINLNRGEEVNVEDLYMNVYNWIDKNEEFYKEGDLLIYYDDFYSR